jgi:thiopurine S-methyltransferase
MDAAFWHQKWENKQIGFHRDEVNPLLVDHIESLDLRKGQTFFLPLCGKTLDITWLLSQGFEVKGVEFYEPAVIALFEGLGLKPKINSLGQLKQYRAENITIYVGDIFDLSKMILGRVDAVYDRAAIVALPESMRGDYTQHVMGITQCAPQLLINYVYDQSMMPGPPFSVTNAELVNHYGNNYVMTLLFSGDVEGGLKGRCLATENVWLLGRH